jgi:hypothetical protein
MEFFLVLRGIDIGGHKSLAFVEEIGNFFHAYLNLCQFACVVILTYSLERIVTGKRFFRIKQQLIVCVRKLIVLIVLSVRSKGADLDVSGKTASIAIKHLIVGLCISHSSFDIIKRFLV